jgi:hypothetical protein
VCCASRLQELEELDRQKAQEAEIARQKELDRIAKKYETPTFLLAQHQHHPHQSQRADTGVVLGRGGDVVYGIFENEDDASAGILSAQQQRPTPPLPAGRAAAGSTRPRVQSARDSSHQSPRGNTLVGAAVSGRPQGASGISFLPPIPMLRSKSRGRTPPVAAAQTNPQGLLRCCLVYHGMCMMYAAADCNLAYFKEIIYWVVERD